MKNSKSITVNFIMNVILTFSSFLFPVLTFPYVSRVLQPEGMGKISFAISVVSYFVLFAELGIPTYGIRACARVRDDLEELSRTVHELFLINLGMSILSYITLAIAIWNVPKLKQEKELFLIISITILLNAMGMEWLYKALEKYTYITVRSIVFKLIAFCAMFFWVQEQKDYIFYGIVSIFAGSASNILNFVHCRKLIIVKPLKGYKFRRHMRSIVIFFAMTCAVTVYTYLDTVMLGFMKLDVDVGYYNAAIRVKTILLSIVTSLSTVLLPRVSYYVEGGYLDEFRRMASKAIEFVVITAIPLCVYCILFAKESIYFLSGEAYSGSIIPMQIIMPTLILIGLTNVMGIQMLVPMGKEKYVLYSEIAGAGVDLFLNVLLIPQYAAAGAALGTLAAEVVVFGVQLYFLRKEVIECFRQIHYGVLLGAILICTVFSYWIKFLEWNVFFTLALSSVLFFGIYVVFLCIMKEPLVIEIKKKIMGKFSR